MAGDAGRRVNTCAGTEYPSSWAPDSLADDHRMTAVVPARTRARGFGEVRHHETRFGWGPGAPGVR
ncbi:hypothetical protein QFZ75_001702 [Streptomyces sp. V3I8]|nr:hypothetical protein [Streptomyces sp. V3I8]